MVEERIPSLVKIVSVTLINHQYQQCFIFNFRFLYLLTFLIYTICNYVPEIPIHKENNIHYKIYVRYIKSIRRDYLCKII